MPAKPAEFVGFKAPAGTNRAIRSEAKRQGTTPSVLLRRLVLAGLGIADTTAERGRPRKNGDA